MSSMRINWLKRPKAIWNFLMDQIAPLGYEDDLGFHYEEPPKRTEPRKLGHSYRHQHPLMPFSRRHPHLQALRTAAKIRS